MLWYFLINYKIHSLSFKHTVETSSYTNINILDPLVIIFPQTSPLSRKKSSFATGHIKYLFQNILYTNLKLTSSET